MPCNEFPLQLFNDDVLGFSIQRRLSDAKISKIMRSQHQSEFGHAKVPVFFFRKKFAFVWWSLQRRRMPGFSIDPPVGLFFSKTISEFSTKYQPCFLKRFHQTHGRLRPIYSLSKVPLISFTSTQVFHRLGLAYNWQISNIISFLSSAG